MQAEDDATPLRPTRASFVRGLPESMPIEEVIERGREAGIQLNPSDIHSVRYYMRREAEQALAKLSSRPVTVRHFVPAAPPATHAAAEKPKPEAKPTSILGLRAANSGKERVTTKTQLAQAAAVVAAAKKRPQLTEAQARISGSLEQQLRQIVMRIGTERARRIIDEIENLKV